MSNISIKYVSRLLRMIVAIKCKLKQVKISRYRSDLKIYLTERGLESKRNRGTAVPKTNILKRKLNTESRD